MKRSTEACVAFAVCACSFLSYSCEEPVDNRNVCTKAHSIMYAADDAVCAGRDDECCMCQCWNQGFLWNTGVAPCECENPRVMPIPDDVCEMWTSDQSYNLEYEACILHPEQCRADEAASLEGFCENSQL